MARYIDADVLDDEVMHLFITITGNPKQHTVVNECKNSFRRMIEEQPKADVAPIVHGEWIIQSDEIDFAKWDQCSECGYKLTCIGHAKAMGMNYCPGCGAKMDGKITEYHGVITE